MSDLITKSITVKKSPAELYRIWSNFEQFPNFMQHIKSIRDTGAGRSHWVMDGPMGANLEWDAKVTEMEPNKRIAWRSIDDDSSDANMKTSGQVTFNGLSNNETEVTVTIKYAPPAGVLGEVGAALFADPEGDLVDDLRNFKAYAEEGTAVTRPVIRA
ncbi:MAG: SRPBCC family protein [Caldilineaceae bacterium]|nr:SRPBCC family protein [Caldilineaceae bacterium]